MFRLLLTCFEPYGIHPQNASRFCLDEFLASPTEKVDIVCREYPVDFEQTRSLLASDWQSPPDGVIHLGQAPGTPAIQLETFAINVGMIPDMPPEGAFPLDRHGPAAIRSVFPVQSVAPELRRAGIPCVVSYHAGTYLCNAVYYWSMQHAQALGGTVPVVFVHLPLDPRQNLVGRNPLPSLPSTICAAGLRIIVQAIQVESEKRQPRVDTL